MYKRVNILRRSLASAEQQLAKANDAKVLKIFRSISTMISRICFLWVAIYIAYIPVGLSIGYPMAIPQFIMSLIASACLIIIGVYFTAVAKLIDTRLRVLDAEQNNRSNLVA